PGGAGVGEGVGVGEGEGGGAGEGNGDGKAVVTVLATRSLISDAPAGVPSPVCVFAVAPDVGLPGLLPGLQPHPQPPQPPSPPQPPPVHGVLVGLAAIEWKSPAPALVEARL